MIAVVLLLAVILVGLLVTRVATAALVATGLSRQFARFQARSAFTGVGFTTSEAELVVNHPVRRRVVMVLMILGNAGIASVVATLLLGFSDSNPGQAARRGLVLVAGMGVIWLLAASPTVDRLLRRILLKLLAGGRELDLRDYAGLLQVGRDYTVGELQVREADWLADRSLAQLALRDEGVIVLGIERHGDYLGTPGGDSVVRAGDTLVVYGRAAVLEELDDRRRGATGELAHVDRVVEHARRSREERIREAG